MGLEKNIVTTVGLDPILLHHFIKHYKSIGVDNFYIVVWGDSKEVKYDEIVNVLKRYDLEVYEDLRDVNNGSPQFLTDIYNKITSTKPDDWWIVADLDEFAVFPKPLDKFIYEDLVYNDIDFMHGIMLDRIGKNGEFSELKYDDDIWEEIPNVGFINRFIRDNDVRWCGLLKGKYELSAGQHTLTHLLMHPDGWKEYIKDNPPKIQVHNFTWRNYDIQKVKYYMEYWKPILSWTDSDGNDHIHYPYDEYTKIDDYLKENEKINISDSRFLIEKCPNDKFDSYLKWEDIIQLPAFSHKE